MIPVSHILRGDRALTARVADANGNKSLASQIRAGVVYRVFNFSNRGEVIIAVVIDCFGRTATSYEQRVPERIWWPVVFPNSGGAGKHVDMGATAAKLKMLSEG